MENVFSPSKLDALFRQAADAQYERELLFSTLVDLVSQVVCRMSKSVHAAYVHQREQISVSIRALYDKLSHVELGTSRALVQHTAGQVRELVDRTKGSRKPLLKGYKVRILDGNHLGKTNRRLGVLRGVEAGALPGQTLVMLDPQRMIIDDVVCCEDGHAQERSLLNQLQIEPRDVLIDDRNFCTVAFLFLLMRRKAYFITRQHRSMPWNPAGRSRYVGRCTTGRVFEQMIQISDSETGKQTQIRRITVKLSASTRDGDKEIHLLTNLPASRVPAVKIAELYRKRWTLEQAFNELTTHLRCELNTLGYPKAALFAFCVAACSYNLLAAVKGTLRGIHGEAKVEKTVSNFFLTNEIHSMYGGMMVALPPEKWRVFQSMRPADLAKRLCRWARAANLENYPKRSCSSKKSKQKRPTAKFRHVATARLLEEKRTARNPKQNKPSARSP
jgi:hypothetical protein